MALISTVAMAKNPRPRSVNLSVSLDGERGVVPVVWLPGGWGGPGGVVCVPLLSQSLHLY